jgi:exosortase/archaeosortase family protein
MKLPYAITPLIRRVIVFLCLFIIISGIVGPRVISGGILFKDGFDIYGGTGKAIIFGVIAFLLIIRHRKDVLELKPWHPVALIWICAASLAFIVAWIGIGNLLAGIKTPQNLLLAHGGIVLSLACTAIGCVGLENIRRVGVSYRREILNAFVIAIAFYAFLSVVYALWQPLASVVLVGVESLLKLSGVHSTLMPPNTLLFDKFGITVAQYCSGIESIALFTGLYIIVGLLDWERLNKRRYIIVFPFALFILCVLNVVRIYGLILAGYYINPVIAFSIFHTYAGLVFFVLYSAAFWAIAYKRLLQPSHHKEKTHL